MLEIKNVNHAYINKKKAFGSSENTPVLNNINLDVQKGDFISIVGPSGCGKSTLINLITGLDSASDGEILINGKKVNGTGNDRTLVFQENALFPWLTVLKNIEFGLRVKRVPRKNRYDRAMLYLDMMGMKDYKDYYIHQLSGGMRQRVSIARALALEPEILLMDEPFGALDSQTKSILHSEIVRIWSNTGSTIIFITHDIEEAVLLANRVVVLGFCPDNIKSIIDVDIERPRIVDGKLLEYVENIKEIITRSSNYGT